MCDEDFDLSSMSETSLPNSENTSTSNVLERKKLKIENTNASYM